MKVLYSCPSPNEQAGWLPYAWGKFREYADRYEPYDLSSVEWLEIAKAAREQNPNIFILAGGPQAKYKPHQDLEDYQIIDYVSPYEGEEVIAETLGRLMNGIPVDDYELLVSPKNPVKTVKAKRIDLSKARPSLALYNDDFVKFSRTIRANGMDVQTPLETNRGCPYKCTFCDWGSATADKIRRYSYDTVMEEIDAMKTLSVGFVFVSDANFGIFDVDLEYTQKLVDTRSKYGSPAMAMFLSAKNKKTISNEAHKLLFNAKMMIGAEIGFQHTDDDVLASIVRSNIKMEKMKEEISEMIGAGIPVSGALILGNPGDTPDKWKTAIDEMLELGFHEDLKIFDFMLLPNAPASDPVYMDRYKIKSMKRYGQTELSISPYGGRHQSQYLADFICATSTFTEDDYIEMQAFSSFVVGQHVMNITRFIAIYLREYHNIPYRKFYEIYSETGMGKEIYQDLKSNFVDYVKNGKINRWMMIEDNLVDTYLYSKAKAILNKDAVFEDVKSIINQLVPDLEDSYIDDLIKTQRATITSWEGPEKVEVEHDFLWAFKKFVKLNPLSKFNKMPIEKTEPTTLVTPNQKVSPMFPYDLSNIKTLERWSEHLSVNTNHNGGGGFYYTALLRD